MSIDKKNKSGRLNMRTDPTLNEFLSIVQIESGEKSVSEVGRCLMYWGIFWWFNSQFSFSYPSKRKIVEDFNTIKKEGVMNLNVNMRLENFIKGHKELKGGLEKDE